MNNYRNRSISHSLMIILALFSICSSAQKTKGTSDNPKLIFQSGFEGTTKVVQDKGKNDYGALYEHITGIDNTLSTKNNWEKDWATVSDKDVMEVQYTGGDSSKRFIKVEKDPTNPMNHILRFWLNDSWLASEGQVKARAQTNIYGIKGGFKEFYQSVRVFLPEDFNSLKAYPKKIGWLTISEFWNNEWWVKDEKKGFRVTLGIGKPVLENSELYFILEAEDQGQKLVWRADYNSSKIAVPIGKWFTMDYYFKEGNKETGRFYLAITPEGGKKQVVYDVHNFTHNTSDISPNGVTGFNPMKLYTSKDLIYYVKSKGKTLQILWDDYKLWENKKPEIIN